MVITQTREPSAAAAGTLALGFVVSGMHGPALAGMVVGPVTGRPNLFWAGLGLFLFNILAISIGAPRRKRAREAEAGATHPALALIESRRATGGETADVPVEFVLSVAPDDAPAFRIKARESINLVDLPDYKPRGILVVEYRPARPWMVEIVTDPTPEWARRAAEETVDSAPESTMVEDPDSGTSFCLVILVGLLLGAAAVIVPFRADLFKDDGPTTETTTSTSTSTSTSSSSFSITNDSSTTRTVSGSVTVDSMLREGEIRRSAESLIKWMATHEVPNLTIRERTMEVEAVVLKATDPAPSLIDLRTLPYEQLPTLVKEARTKLGIAKPTAWRITFEPDPTKSLTIRVTVTDSQGTASLEADLQANISKRTPR